MIEYLLQSPPSRTSTRLFVRKVYGMRNARLERSLAPKFAGLSAAIILSLVAGCGAEHREARQIEKAKQTVNALTADGTFTNLNDAYRRAELTKIHDEMKSLADSGPDSFKAAAYSIASRAKAGIASLDAKAANDADAQLTAQLDALTNGLNTYTLQKSIAESNTGAGTQDLIKTLQASLEANKKNTADAGKAASKVQATVDELTTRSKTVAAQAQAKRDEASELASTVQTVSATSGLEILKHSAAVRAEADALERQSADLSTQLGLAQAELARARSNAAALEGQSRQIQSTIAAAQTRVEEEHKLAEAAGKAADAAAASVKKGFDDLTAFRATLDKAHQDAVNSSKAALDLATQAENKARASGNQNSIGGGNTGKISSAAMQQGHADALVSQARAQDMLAGTLGLIASAKPALPNAAEFDSAAKAARKSADDTLDDARKKYGEVKASIDAIGDEKLKARLAETSRLLEGLSSKQGVKTPEAAPAPAAPAAATPSATPAADSPELAAIKKTLDAVFDKLRAGDIAAINNEFTAFDNDKQRENANALAELQAVSAAFEKACQDKLNASSKELLGPMMGGMSQAAVAGEAVKNLTSADFQVTVSGDTATASSDAGISPKLVKRDGKWMLKGGLLGDVPGLDGRMLTAIKSTMKEITDDINSGKISSAQQLQTTLMAKMGPMMGGGRGTPGGGGGGGGEDDPNK